MSPIVEFREGEVARADEVVYHSSDVSLVYRHRPTTSPDVSKLADQIDHMMRIRRDEEFLVMADTLTMVFSGATPELIAFDAYTNRERWTLTMDLVLPNVYGTGRICLTDPLPGGRIAVPMTPTYAYSSSQSRLEISLGRMPGTKYYRVSDRLIVGLSGGELGSLLVEGLAIKV